jgi:hypothetical protein
VTGVTDPETGSGSTPAPQPRFLTPEEAQAVFDAMAAKGDRIAFRYLAEGCECRAQLMIEEVQALGIEPGRAWALAVGRQLAVPHPTIPKQTYKWLNHVAPTVAVEGVEHSVLVIDPSLSATGPLSLGEWAGVMRARAIEVSEVGLSQAEILSRQAARALQGEDLDAMLFKLKLGEPPILEVGGSGFRIAPDPPEGISAFARKEMQILLAKEKRLGRGPP